MANCDEALKNASVVTTNACKLCTPLGACIAIRGIEGAMPMLHGSQGCATYMRRYVISHFREPIDIASSNFTENTTIFGGKGNLATGLNNVIAQYNPDLIGVATTCLSETIGEDLPSLIKQYQTETEAQKQPFIIPISTPSYRGTHINGFQTAVRAVVAGLAKEDLPQKQLNILPGLVSPADIYYIKEILAEYGLKYALLPDYSETLDGPTWDEYQSIPAGGTPIAAIQSMGSAVGTLEFGRTLDSGQTAGGLLQERFKVPNYLLGMPIGVRGTDQFFEVLKTITRQDMPNKYRYERGRLIDAYIDGHKYVFEKKAVVYGEEDLVAGLAGFLAEVGIIPVLCASGGKSGRLSQAIREAAPEIADQVMVQEGIDFMEIAEETERLGADLLIGNSKGYQIARSLKIPLIRVGFPIHDRFGGQRLLHLGYRGTGELFDRIVNAILAHRQEASPVGYSYL